MLFVLLVMIITILHSIMMKVVLLVLLNRYID